MTNLVELLKKLLRDITLFTRYTSGLRLRSYQEAVARAIVNSVLHHKGYTFVVILPRQSGKNELQAQIQAYLLTLTSDRAGEMVQVSPTWRPQTENAMHRLESVLSRNLIVKDRWEKRHGHIYQVGKARLVFLSGSPSANIVGATASLLLSVDEAQDILIDKYDKEIAPMAASTNATRVFWGTAWTADTLLAREEKAALAQQAADGVRRVWRLDCDQVAAEVPAYGQFVADQVARLGREHPMVRTQYFSEDIDAVGGLFPPERLALIYGSHPPLICPLRGEIYAMTLDVAGEDGGEVGALSGLANPGRDYTALTIARANLATLSDPALMLPTYEIVYRQQWIGVKHVQIYAQILSLAQTWQVRHLVVDATGVGAGLSAFLARTLGGTVIPFTFNSRSKSDLGWAFLAMVDSGRLKDYAPGNAPGGAPAKQAGVAPGNASGGAPAKQAGDAAGHTSDSTLSRLHAQFFEQLAHCQYEIQPGPEKKIQWSVPNGTRHPASGEWLHDDLLICAALFSVLDQQAWAVSAPSVVINAADPLEEMQGF